MKIHLRRSKIVEGKDPISVCAARGLGGGKVTRNSRSTYRAIECVDMDAFLATQHSDRCAHCLDMGLIWLNSIRRKKGWPLYATFSEYEAKQANRVGHK